jgi:hypothetical protein
MELASLQSRIDAKAAKVGQEAYQKVWAMFPRDKRHVCGGDHQFAGKSCGTFFGECKDVQIGNNPNHTLAGLGIENGSGVLDLVQKFALLVALEAQVQEKARLESELLEFAETLYDGIPEGFQRED